MNSLNEETAYLSKGAGVLPTFGAAKMESSNENQNHEEEEEHKDNIDRLIDSNGKSKEAAWFEKAYPFKADDFGQLVLPDNVCKAKLVSLNNYGAMVPMNLIMSNRSSSSRHHAPSESQTSGTYYLFTVDESDYLTLYKIKSYLTSPFSNIISNFKMAKKMDVLLEFPVQNLEWISQDRKNLLGQQQNCYNFEAHRKSKHLIMPNFLITYQDQALIDLFDEKGTMLHRVDMSAVFEAYDDLIMVKLEHVKLPKLIWSCRSLNLLPTQVSSSNRGRDISLTEKLITAGLCNYKGTIRPFLARIALTFSIPDIETPGRDEKKHKQVIKVDAEVIKIIGGEDYDEISALAFGPYDNGYALAGMQSGRLLVYDPVTLDRVKDFNVFTKGKMRGELRAAEPITSIQFEPTELVFVASS